MQFSTREPHLTFADILAYCAGKLEQQVLASVERHIFDCRSCSDALFGHARASASLSGFDPLTGERYHLDGQIDITGINGLHAFWNQGQHLAHAADAQILPFPVADERIDRDVVKVTVGDRTVKVDISEDPPGELLARARANGEPVPGVEVRIELRGYDEDDHGFELYAWGVTGEDGSVNLGPVRPVEPGFPSGYRFVFGVVLPPSDD